MAEWTASPTIACNFKGMPTISGANADILNTLNLYAKIFEFTLQTVLLLFVIFTCS